MIEQEIEQELIDKLSDLKYEYRPDINDRATLEKNFREKFEALNRVRLTGSEFSRLLEEIITKDVFIAARTLRERSSFIREDGTPLNYTLVNIRDWCKNTFEVIKQLRITTDNSHHRYDVIILINGVPTVQIELKTLGINSRRAMEQIVQYKNDPGNGYTRTLLCFVQLFIVSNRDSTYYFANNNARHFAFNAEERFLPIYQFAGVDNKKITHLGEFAHTFLVKCTLGHMISRYMVLIAGEQKLLVMRPYQIYAVKAIVDCIHQNCGNGFIWHTTGSGKTRLSMEFKTAGKNKNAGAPDTLYFNAFTEDLFVWDNDLQSDSKRVLRLNSDSRFFSGIKELALDENIRFYLSRYTDLDFAIDYTNWTVSFSKGTAENIKVSRGEENIFVLCLFMAICERVIDAHPSYDWVKYFYIDDPISSLDDNNAIAVASDLAKLPRKAKDRNRLVDATENGVGSELPPKRKISKPIKVVISSHHALFFNVVCNELKTAKTKRYFLHRPNNGEEFTLRATDDTPFFHHVAMLSEIRKAADSGALFTYHFNMLRSILEKTATFFGKKDFSACLEGAEDEALFSRALNLLSHGRYSLYEPTEMLEDNKQLFRDILSAFLAKHQFDLPALLNEPAAPAATPAVTAPGTAPAPEEEPAS